MDTPRKSSRRALMAVLAIGASASTIALAGGSAQAYPPQPPNASIDVVTLGPDCVLDVPYVSFSLRAVGFESSGPTKVTVRDLDGNVVIDTFESPGLSGSFVYPGAAVGSDGKATDWPGWKQLADGTWVEDPDDAHLRDGVSVTFEVNPSATQTVTYPASDSECFGPAQASASGASPAQASLPSTGNSGMSTTLLAGGLALLLGVLLTSWNVVSNRRRSATDVS